MSPRRLSVSSWLHGCSACATSSSAGQSAYCFRWVCAHGLTPSVCRHTAPDLDQVSLLAAFQEACLAAARGV